MSNRLRTSISFQRGIALPELLALMALLFLILTVAIPLRSRLVLRSGVSRARLDVLRIGEALDVYHLDNSAYPPSVALLSQTKIPPIIYGLNKRPPLTSHRQALTRLTTPVAYLPSITFNAPFAARAWEITEAERRNEPFSYWYNNYNDFYLTSRGGAVAPIARDGFLVLAFGPDSRGVDGISAPYRDIMPGIASVPALNRPNILNIYDPTNGLHSFGNIARFGGNLGLEDGVPYYPNGGGK